MPAAARSAVVLFGLLTLSIDAAQAEVQTWWHPNEELNDNTAVAPGNVRRSTVYDVRVAAEDEPGVLHDSFAYMSLPRSGRPKEGYTEQDGTEFSVQVGMTMSWSSFLYEGNAWVYVELKQGPPLESADEVTIRPTRLGFHKELVDERTVRILVPYAREGYRFSVEFDSQLLTMYEGPDGALTTEAAANPEVHTEPRNGLMIFAEPMLTGRDLTRLVPDPSAHSIHYPQEGNVSYLHEVTDEVIYFRPGTYTMDWNYHADLQPSVRWIHLAPGAYVKGAFQVHAATVEPDEPTRLNVTGFGVISGELYVYEADRANGYRHRPASRPDCHGSCVKLLEFEGGPGHVHLTIHGITLANAPYHSFVIHGEPRLVVDASHGKQVGGWYWQTDGIEAYDDSTMAHMFFHLNDDVLKLYGSRTEISDIVVWKMENGPVIQWGWAPRNIDLIHVDGVDVIHNRMHWDNHNTCIINSARHYLDPASDRMADPRSKVSQILIWNVRAEGKNLCAMRLYALSSWENIFIANLWIEEWNDLDPARQASRLEALSNEAGERVSIGNQVRDRRGVSLVDYVVGDERITKPAGNWPSDRPGRLDFDSGLWENWNAR